MGFRKGRRMLTARNTLSTVALVVVFTVSALTAGCSGSTATSGQAPVPSFTWKPTTTQAVGTVLHQSQVIGLAADDRAFVLAALGPKGNPLIDGIRAYAVSELFTSGDDGASWRRVTVPGLTALAQQPVAGFAGRLTLPPRRSIDPVRDRACNVDIRRRAALVEAGNRSLSRQRRNPPPPEPRTPRPGDEPGAVIGVVAEDGGAELGLADGLRGTWVFTGFAGLRSGYVKVSGIAAPRG